MKKNACFSVINFEVFANYIQSVINESDLDYIDLNAGEIHRVVGNYPGKNHRMPICCEAMRSLMESTDLILYQPKKGNGASLTIRYYRRTKMDSL